MIVHDFYLRDYDWTVRGYFAVDKYYIDDILGDLWYIGLDGKNAKDAYKNLYANKLNTGLCFSSAEKRMTIIVTAITTEAREFAHSWVHELTHCACHIAKAEGIDKTSEEFAYLTGDLALQTFPVVKKLLCDCCRE